MQRKFVTIGKEEWFLEWDDHTHRIWFNEPGIFRVGASIGGENNGITIHHPEFFESADCGFPLEAMQVLISHYAGQTEAFGVF